MIARIVTVLASYFLFVFGAIAQVGISTTTPNYSLFVRGSLANNYRPFVRHRNVLLVQRMGVQPGGTRFKNCSAGRSDSSGPKLLYQPKNAQESM